MFSDDDLQYERDYIEHLKAAALLAGVQGKRQLSKDLRREKRQREQILQDMIEVNAGIADGTYGEYNRVAPTDDLRTGEQAIDLEKLSPKVLAVIDELGRKVRP